MITSRRGRLPKTQTILSGSTKRGPGRPSNKTKSASQTVTKRGPGRPPYKNLSGCSQASTSSLITQYPGELYPTLERLTSEAERNIVGCLLSTKVPNQGGCVSTYIWKTECAKEFDEPKKLYVLHRVAMYFHGTALDRARMKLKGWHVSHLCHQKNCFNSEHLVVETRAANEARKACQGRMPTVRTVDGTDYPSPRVCQCKGKRCIPMVEVRVKAT